MELSYPIEVAESATERNEKVLSTYWKKILCGLAVLTILFHLDNRGNLLIGTFITSALAAIQTEQLRYDALAIEAQMSHGLLSSKNPNYHTVIEILQMGIEEYVSGNPGNAPFWQISPEYISDLELLSRLKFPLTRENLLAELPSMAAAHGSRPVVPGTHLDVISASDTEVQDYYELVRKDLEEICAQQYVNAPLSQSRLLAYFLKRTNGDIALAIADATGFLKYVTRGDMNAGYGGQVQWLLRHIQVNQYKVLQLHESETQGSDKRDVSAAGEPYHFFNELMLASKMSASVITIAVLHEYKSYGDDMQPVKELADLDTVSQLPGAIEFLQNNYAKIAS